ncbi:hypothetical protein Pcinc_030662 [Petrolisthes cinctipes]|uniref:Uncharacterized protein n=1 Tax=Petrolisthes cinctipes TaxID=88211 RepID=A0AAE1EY84_PETCI|nr:hypothetical protein Pcinc_030662 [Petrolisthes cinctipes]
MQEEERPNYTLSRLKERLTHLLQTLEEEEEERKREDERDEEEEETEEEMQQDYPILPHKQTGQGRIDPIIKFIRGKSPSSDHYLLSTVHNEDLSMVLRQANESIVLGAERWWKQERLKLRGGLARWTVRGGGGDGIVVVVK